MRERERRLGKVQQHPLLLQRPNVDAGGVEDKNQIKKNQWTKNVNLFHLASQGGHPTFIPAPVRSRMNFRGFQGCSGCGQYSPTSLDRRSCLTDQVSGRGLTTTAASYRLLDTPNRASVDIHPVAASLYGIWSLSPPAGRFGSDPRHQLHGTLSPEVPGATDCKYKHLCYSTQRAYRTTVRHGDQTHQMYCTASKLEDILSSPSAISRALTTKSPSTQ